MTLRARRIAFAVYAAALFIGTHIPDLRVSVPHVDRPDLLIHMGAFGGWFCFLLASELLGPWRAPRSILLCAVIAIGCAAVDEYSQSLPGLNRTSAWDDLAANVSGIVLASVAALLLARFSKPKPTGATDSALPSATPHKPPRR